MQKLLFLILLTFALTKVELPAMSAPTPHIAAKKGDFAKTVLMPGDPKRAKYIAEKFLKDAKLVNDVRGVQGYTGEYKGKRVSVMASGMGIPSIGIYSYELYNAFGVEKIIRVGSAGSIHDDINLKDIVVGIGASTNSNFQKNYNLPGSLSATASFDLLKKADETGKKLGYGNRLRFGQILSSDTFYTDKPGADLEYAKMGVLAVEMEAYGLYLTAARCGKQALAICTISDQLVKHQFLSAEERQLSFDEMITLALEMAD